MYYLNAIHSSLRWVLLIILLISIAQAFSGWFGKKEFTPQFSKSVLYTVIVTHLQFVLGLVMYFMSGFVDFNMSVSMKNPVLRFFTVEHIAMMVVAIVLITLGSALSKRGKTDEAKYKRVAICFTLALVIILAAIPWPFREALGRNWF